MRTNIENALLWLAYLIISRNGQKLARKYPRVLCFSFNYIGNYINCYGRYEDSQLMMLRKIVIEEGRGSAALDVGANIGNHSIFFAEFFKTVIALEPNPDTFSVLKINTRDLNNIACLMIGASSRKETRKFSVNHRNMGGSRIISEDLITSNSNYSQITIEVQPIDLIDEVKHEQIGLVKIDVEGHELDTLRGMSELLRRDKPIIAFEQEATQITNGSSEVLRELEGAGYKYLYAKECRMSLVSNVLPSFLRIPLQLLEIAILGDARDSARFHVVKESLIK